MTENRKIKKELAYISISDKGYTVNSPLHKGLVLSGGGAKGIAYVGMLKAFEKRGRLKHIRYVNGASAGAITASLVAIGISSDLIQKIVEHFNLIHLIDGSSLISRGEGERIRHLLNMVYLVQLHSLLKKIERPRSVAKALIYDKLLQKYQHQADYLSLEGIVVKTMNDVIELIKSPIKLMKTGAILKNKKDIRFNFSDLYELRNLLPPDKKYLIKKLGVVATNQSKNRLDYFSKQSNPTTSIADAVQWSSAHPVLFMPALNDTGDYMADGGILDNMPEINELTREQVICVKAQNDKDFLQRKSAAKVNTLETISNFFIYLDKAILRLIGGSWIQANLETRNKEKIYRYMDNMLFLNTGSISTISMYVSIEEKKIAIQNGYDQTLKFIDAQNKTFDNPLLAMLYLGYNQLDKTMLNENAAPELFTAAVQAKTITLIQEYLVEEMKSNNYRFARLRLKEIEDILIQDAQLAPIQKEKAYSLCLKQINYLSEGRLDRYLSYKAEKERKANAPSFGTRALLALHALIEWVLSVLQQLKVKAKQEVSEPNLETIASPTLHNP